MRTLYLGLLGSALLAPAAAAQIFVPARSVRDPAELNARINLLMRSDFRAQSVLDASEMPGPASLTQVALRYDGPSYSTAGGTLASFEVWLAPAAVAANASTAIFAANHAGALTRVVAATNVNFPADSLVDPGPWGGPGGVFTFPFSAPFAYSGTGLVVELRGRGNSNAGASASNCHFDAELDPLNGPTDGTATLNGAGCRTAAMTVSGRLAPGSSVTCAGTGLGAGAFVVNTLGGSRTNWLGVPLPFDLAGFNAPGCLVHNDIITDLRTLADGNCNVGAFGATTWPVPPLPSLANVRLQFQMLALVPQVAATNNAEVRLGTYRPLVRGYASHVHHASADAAIASYSGPIVPAMRFN